MSIKVSKTEIILLAAIFVATLLTYSNHFHNALHFDDAHTISNNMFIRDLKNVPLFFKDGTTGSILPSNQFYRPVLVTTLAIDYKLGGGLSDTFFFHLTSFTFFLLQGFLMFFLFKRIIQKSSPSAPADWIAAFAVGWYMLHPACAETINYIIQRGDSLSTFFTLLGLMMYITGGISRKYYLYLIPVLLGCLTKPLTLMFAPLLLVYILLFEDEVSLVNLFSAPGKIPFAKIIKQAAIPFAAVAVIFLIMKKMESSTYVAGGFSKFNYWITQPFILFHQFRTWFSPTELTADSDWMAFDKISNPYVIGGFVFLLAAVYMGMVTSASKMTRPISFGIFWFLIANVPTSLIPFSEVTNDHRMFFPFVGLAIGVTWTLYLLGEKFSYLNEKIKSLRIAFFVTIFLLLAGYAWGTHQRNEVWKTDEGLWADVAEKSPKNGRGLMNYGLALMARGDYADAEYYYTQALKYSPYYSYLHVNMAILKDAVGKSDEAEQYFKKAIQFSIGSPNTYFYYGRFLNSKNRKEEAVSYLKKGEQIAPADINMRYLLMDCLFDLGRLEELKMIAQKTLELFPGDKKASDYLLAAQKGKSKLQVMEETAASNKTPEDYLNLSLYYYNIGRFEDCIKACQDALKLKPDYATAYNNMCSAYNSLGKWTEGMKACEQALKIQPDFQLAKNNLEWARKNLKQ